MNELLTIVQDVVNQLKSIGPEVLTVLSVIGVGYVIRSLPFIDNRFIPTICILFGPVAHILIGDPGSTSFKSRNPEVVLGMFGLLYGVIGWVMHHHVLWHVERWIGEKRSRKVEDKPEKTEDIASL
jgi:hypothetical protein